MPRKCCLSICKEPGKHFFAFPNDLQRHKLWSLICDPYMRKLRDNIAQLFVCSNHFEKDEIEIISSLKGNKGKLRVNAVPKIVIDGKVVSNITNQSQINSYEIQKIWVIRKDENFPVNGQLHCSEKPVPVQVQKVVVPEIPKETNFVRLCTEMNTKRTQFKYWYYKIDHDGVYFYLNDWDSIPMKMRLNPDMTITVKQSDTERTEDVGIKTVEDLKTYLEKAKNMKICNGFVGASTKRHSNCNGVYDPTMKTLFRWKYQQCVHCYQEGRRLHRLNLRKIHRQERAKSKKAKELKKTKRKLRQIEKKVVTLDPKLAVQETVESPSTDDSDDEEKEKEDQ